jgi:hypothetical protein
VTLNFFLLHNETTWTHFLPPKNPFVPSPFTPFFSLARLQKFSKEKKKKALVPAGHQNIARLLFFNSLSFQSNLANASYE